MRYHHANRQILKLTMGGRAPTLALIELLQAAYPQILPVQGMLTNSMKLQLKTHQMQRPLAAATTEEWNLCNELTKHQTILKHNNLSGSGRLRKI